MLIVDNIHPKHLAIVGVRTVTDVMIVVMKATEVEIGKKNGIGIITSGLQAFGKIGLDKANEIGLPITDTQAVGMAEADNLNGIDTPSTDTLAVETAEKDPDLWNRP